MHKAVSAIGFLIGMFLLVVVSYGGIHPAQPLGQTSQKISHKKAQPVEPAYQNQQQVLGELKKVITTSEALKRYQMGTTL